MPTASIPVNIAIIGAGGVSRHHLPPFLEAPEEVRLAAVCDARQEAASALAEQLPYPVTTCSDHRAVIGEGTIDAAVIALPHHLHFPIAVDFIEAGIPVLIEKPLTCTLDEARRLRDLARQHGVSVAAGQMRRFNREAVWLRRWMLAEATNFGQLHTFDMQSWQNIMGWLGRTAAKDPWLLDRDRAGGGVVISLAVHQLDLVRFLTGCDYEEVTATGRFDPPFVNGAESAAVVLLKMTNGAVGMLHASYTTPRTPYSEAMNLFGEYGTIIQRAERVGDYHGPFRYATVTGRETSAWHHMYENLEQVPEDDVSDLHRDPFVNQMLHFARAVREHETPENHVDENLNTMACIQAINDSLRSGHAEKVSRD